MSDQHQSGRDAAASATTRKHAANEAPESRERFTLKQGTSVTVDGVTVQLVSDTEIESNQSDHDALAELTGTTFAEYPKRVKNADGVEKNVNGPEEEAAWLNPPVAGETVAQSKARRTGLEDVSVDDDAPHKQSRGDSHKKK